MLLSQYLRLSNELEDLGVLDVDIDSDIPYFINIQILRNIEVAEFKKSYNHINEKFIETIFHLKNSKTFRDDEFQLAFSAFKSSGFSEICLGYSTGKIDHGFGEDIINRCLMNAQRIVNAGVESPELFHLSSLFVKGVGCDLLSDMIATYIIDDIREYTKNINRKLNIVPSNEKLKKLGIRFNNEFLRNDSKNGRNIYYVPKKIVSVLPINKGYHDVNTFIGNQLHRNEFSSIFKQNYKDISSDIKKDHVIDLLCKLEVSRQIIDEYRNIVEPKYDFEIDKQGADISRRIGDIIIDKSESKINWSIDTDLKIIPNEFVSNLDLFFQMKSNRVLLKLNGKFRSRIFFATLFKNMLTKLLMDVSKVTLNSSTATLELKKSGEDIQMKIMISREDTLKIINTFYEENKLKSKPKKIHVVIINTSKKKHWIDQLKQNIELNKNKQKFPVIHILDVFN